VLGRLAGEVEDEGAQVEGVEVVEID
jgi:hypothetical protein